MQPERAADFFMKIKDLYIATFGEEAYRNRKGGIGRGTLRKDEYIAIFGQEEWEKEQAKRNARALAYHNDHKEEAQAYQKEYNKTHKEEKRVRNRRWNEKHKEELAIKRKEYYSENKERLDKVKKEYYEKNKEKIKAWQKKYNNEHKEEKAEYAKKYQALNREYFQEYGKKYREETGYNLYYYNENREKINERRRSRYANSKMDNAKFKCKAYRKTDASKGFDKETVSPEWVVNNIYTSKCVYCGDSEWRHLGCDRIDNGKGHTKDNVVCSCAICNIERQYRGASVEEFKQYRKLHPRECDVKAMAVEFVDGAIVKRNINIE